MAQYKVLQDIEAEDKLVGPLSLRQFIYAIIVVALGFVAFQVGTINFFLAIPFLPPILFFGLLAAPLGHSQSSEVWLLGKFRYWLYPKKRIWDQSGIQELVKINVPKKVEKQLTKDFDKEEAKSRLEALASTLDTRGWAIKNISQDTYRRSARFSQNDSSDRLVAIETMPQESIDSQQPDQFDPETSPAAQKLNSMIESNEFVHRQELLDRMQQLRQNNGSAPVPAQAAPQQTSHSQQQTAPVVRPQPNANPEPALPTNQPIITHQPRPGMQNATATIPRQQPTTQKAQPAMTTPANTAILNDVKQDGRTSSNSQSAAKSQNGSDSGDGEVVISLH